MGGQNHKVMNKDQSHVTKPNALTATEPPTGLFLKMAEKAISKTIEPPYGDYEPEELIEMLAGGGLSAMATNDQGRQMRLEFYKDDIICNTAFFLAFNPVFQGVANAGERLGFETWGDNYRQTVLKIVGSVLPYEELPVEDYDKDEDKSNGKLVVCNHPSSGDPPMSAIWAIRRYPDKKILMPVDLPRFEAIGRWHQALGKAWVNIMPVIPPEVSEYMGSSEDMDELKNILFKRYHELALEYLANGDMVAIAQPAAMHKHLFADKSQYETGVSADGEKNIRPVGMLLNSAKKTGILDKIDVVPHAYSLAPDADFYVFNMFKKSKMHIGKIRSGAELVEADGGKCSTADYRLLKEMADNMGMPEEYKYKGIESELGRLDIPH
ncbi:MAG: hypothetical protein LBL08_01785 [Candidatus Nomurabacteria bacterium]|jgi:hypothetical protein|nr:hypothetical protein [Candidatus Nomurabacteria bacterium]